MIKIFGMIALLAVMQRGLKVGEKQISYLINFTKIVATQSEVNGLSKSIYVELVMLNRYRLPQKSQDAWEEYFREAMRSDDKIRDTAFDLWGTTFRVREVKQVTARKGAGYEVRSAGPDQKIGNEDDVVALNSYQ